MVVSVDTERAVRAAGGRSGGIAIQNNMTDLRTYGKYVRLYQPSLDQPYSMKFVWFRVVTKLYYRYAHIRRWWSGGRQSKDKYTAMAPWSDRPLTGRTVLSSILCANFGFGPFLFRLLFFVAVDDRSWLWTTTRPKDRRPEPEPEPERYGVTCAWMPCFGKTLG